MDLTKLFNEVNPKCNGCPVLLEPVAKHSVMDYEGIKQNDVLFVSDSLKLLEGDYVPFRVNEYNLIMREIRNTGWYENRPAFTASVKCPNIKEKDLKPETIKICRQHLIDTILQIKPKLVFACGKMPTTMFHGKKVKEGNVRGKAVDFEMGGHNFKLVPVFHPYQVIAEPRNAYLFSLDISNNIDAHILGISRDSKFEFHRIFSIEDLNKHTDLFETTDPVSNDIEATGLNFLEDTIHTTAFSILDSEALDRGLIVPKKTISIPLDHFANKQGLYFKAKVCEFVANVFKNKRNRKVLQKANYDLKFWMRYGVTDFQNIWDTKIMQHFYKEDVPKSLSDLVSYYFPNEKF